MLDITFNQIHCKSVPGYLISTVYTPAQGMQGEFFVYLQTRYSAAAPLAPVQLGAAGPAEVGTLTITGDGRSYTFPQITLTSAEPGATRRERFQFLELQYPLTPNAANEIPAVLTNQGGTELQKAALGDDYTYGLDQFPEQLLGFQMRQSKTDAVVVRFQALRNSKNSFLEKVVSAHNAQQKDANEVMKPFDIKFSQGNIQATRNNLVCIHVVEAYGEGLCWPIPHLAEYVQQTNGLSLARLTPPSFLPGELIEHNNNREFHPRTGADTVEIATFVFAAGTVNLAIR